MAVLIGFPTLQFLKAVQLSDGGVTGGQIPLLLQQSLTSLHQPGQRHLLLIGEQINPANVLQVQPQQICRAAAAAVAGFPGPSGLTGQRRGAIGLPSGFPAAVVSATKALNPFGICSVDARFELGKVAITSRSYSSSWCSSVNREGCTGD